MKRYLLLSAFLFLFTSLSFAQLGDSMSNPLVVNGSSLGFSYSNTTNTTSFTDQYSGRSTNDVFFRFTLTKGMIMTLTHEGSGVTDTYMHVLNSSGTRIAYNDDYSGEGHCSSTYNSYIKIYLEAGTYYVVSEGYSQNGVIQTNITGTVPPIGDVMSNPINGGSFSTDFTYSNTVNTNNFSNQYTGRSTNDAYHKFVLSVPMNVTLTHEGSSLSNTYMSLLSSTGNLIVSNDNYTGDGHCSNTNNSFIQRQLNAGTYYVVSEGYSSNGSIKVNIVGETSNGFNYPVIPSSYNAESSYSVGAMGGVFDVSPLGGATYTIPIAVPLGVNGLQPNVSVVYNSQSGNGMVGYGFIISGLSSITRGPKNIYHDGAAHGMEYQGDDAFYLDGVRLICTYGTPGQDGAIYRPESDPFTMIRVNGNINGNTMWFEVTDKAGIKYKYGYSTGRHTYSVDGANKTMSWYVDYVEDPFGNEMVIDYIKYSNVIYPSVITYGMNNKSVNNLRNYVYFDYTTRTDVVNTKYDGVECSMDRKLYQIRTKTGSSTYRTYEFLYSTSGDATASKYSRLTSVKVKNGNNEYLPPIEFTWSYLPATNYTARSLNVGTLSSPTVPLGNQKFGACDLNGDGIEDLIGIGDCRDNAGRPNMCVYKYLSSRASNGTISHNIAHEYKFVTSYSQVSGDVSNYLVESLKTSRLGSSSVVDFDGDGNNEYLVGREVKMLDYDPWSTGILRKYLEFYMLKGEDDFLVTKTLLSTEEKPIYATGDINNDGKTDIVVLETECYDSDGFLMKMHILSSAIDPSEYNYNDDGSILSASLDYDIVTSTAPRQVFLSDMNGDGLQDLLILYSQGYVIHYNQGGSLTQSNWIFSNASSDCSSGTNLKSAYMVVPGDYNGDGMLDILSNDVNSNTWYIYLNTGKGTFTSYTACTLDKITKHNFTDRDDEKFTCSVLDFDGDGKDDVVITKAVYDKKQDKFLGIVLSTWGEFNKTHTYWMRSTGTSLTQVHHATSNKDGDALYYRVTSGDFDGDGRMEMMNLGNDIAQGSNANNEATFKYYDISSYSDQTGKITKIIGDYGLTTDITYTTLANNTVYSRGTNDSYPAPKITAPMSVVKSVVSSNGAAGNTTISMTYEGLKIHKQGRGLLGFTKTIVTNSTTGLVSESGINTWDATYYMPTSTYTKNTLGGAVSLNTITTTYEDFTSLAPKMFFAKTTTVAARDYDNNLITTTSEYNINNGTLTRESCTYGTGNDMYVIKEYQNYLTKGRRYQPRTETVRAKYPGDDELYTTMRKFVYNNTTGAVEQVVDNYTMDLPLTTNYSYTPHGNIASKKIQGTGIEAYTQYYSYDDTKRFVTQEYSSPAAFVLQYTYDTWGNRLTETDNTNSDNPITSSFEYDNWGNLVRSTIAGEGTTLIKRGWNINTAKRYFILTEGDNMAWTKTWYDNQGREVQTQSIGLNNVTINRSINYNNKGLVASIANTEGDKTITENYTYDNRGRKLTATSTSGSSVSYEYGNLMVVIRSNNQATIREYDAMGNLIRVTDPSLSTVEYHYSSNGKLLSAEIDNQNYSFTYDAMGNKISYTDPDAGTTTYTYDALGREITRTDPRNVHYTNTYDFLGHITSSTAGNETITYTYGTSGNNKLRLVQETMGNWSNNYSYDSYGRIIAAEVGGHRTEYQYSATGMLARKTWADSGSTGKYVDYSYDSYGNVIGENAISGAIVWSLTGYTGRNTTSTIKLHSNANVFTKTTALGTNGYLSSRSLTRGGTTISGMTYTYNGVTGNLSQRVNNGITESYSYDVNDRLTGMTKGGQQVMSVSYDANGNISYKNDIGNYYYNESSKPHAVASVDNSSNLIPDGAQTITYNAWGKVSEVNATVGNDTYRYELTYGPHLQRVLAVLWKNNELVHLVTYGDDYEEKYMNGEITRYYYVNGIDGNSAVYTSHTLTGDKAYCIDKDQMGSIIGLYDQYGNKCYGADFDPWGRRTVMTGSIEYDRGFTGHEHIDELGLIDMNGRMYDPLLGRFISVDPFIQMPENPQNYNRYSYCLNNPLKYTDPSGCLFGIDDIIIVAAFQCAVMNTMVQASAGKINNFGDYMAAFGIGALAGGLGSYLGATVVGALHFGGAAAGAIGGAVGGATTGFITGAGNAWVNGASFGSGLGAGCTSSFMAGALGAISGGLMGGIVAKMQGYSFWDGSSTVFDYADEVVEKVPTFVEKNYNSSSKAEFDTEFLQERYMDEYGLKEGNLNIRKITTRTSGRYHLTSSSRYYHDGHYVNGYCTSYNNGYQEIHISPYILYSDQVTFRATAGHELIHACHNFSFYPYAPNANYTETVAHNYSYSTLYKAGYYDQAFTRHYFMMQKGWVGTVPYDYYYSLFSLGFK